MTRFGAVTGITLLVILGWATAGHGETTDFKLLPALKSDLAVESLLLGAARSEDRLLVGGERGHILFSDDGGRSWTHADVPVSLAITSVAFAGRGHAWAAAHDGYLLHSADNGQTWQTKLSGSDVARLSVGAIEQQVEALGSALDDAAPENREDLEWALEDAEIALEEATLAIDEGMSTPLLKVWFDGDDGYALGAYGVFLRSRDGGESWAMEANRLDNPDKYHLYAIARSSAGTLLVAGEAGTVLRSLDDGESWERIDAPYAGSFFGSVASGDGSLLIFGLRGNVFRSTDEGETWAAVDTGDDRTLMCGVRTDAGPIVLTGSAGVLLQSSDGGESFREIPTEGNRVYSGITDTPDGKILLVGFGGVSVVEQSAQARVKDDGDE